MSTSVIEKSIQTLIRKVAEHDAIFERLRGLFNGKYPSREDLMAALLKVPAPNDAGDVIEWSPTYEEWAAERSNAVARADERDEYARRLGECEAEREVLQKKLQDSSSQTAPWFQAKCDSCVEALNAAEARNEALKDTLKEVQEQRGICEQKIALLRTRNRLLCPEDTSAHAGHVVYTLRNLLTLIATDAQGTSITTAGKALLDTVYFCDGWHIAFGPREVLPREGSIDLGALPRIPAEMDASWRAQWVVWHLFQVNERESVCQQLEVEVSNSVGAHDCSPSIYSVCLSCIHWLRVKQDRVEE